MEDHDVARSGRLAPVVARSALLIVLLAVASACSSAATPSAGIPTPLQSGAISIEAKEYQFTPSTITVPAGDVTFSIKNAGTQDHEFKVFKGDQEVGGVAGFAPGLTKDATLTLAAGDYTFVCKLNGHDQLGMKGTLTVTGG
jgi:iron uptake system component EfeO